MRGVLIIGLAALLVAPAAFAGTAVFAGTANDTDAQLQGPWVSYLPTSIGNIYSEHVIDNTTTTNLTSLLGTRTLPNFGTMSLVLTAPNDQWSDWWGAWITGVLSAGADAKISFGIGPPYDWAYYEWVYIEFGSGAGSTKVVWNQDTFTTSAPPVGLRLTSDGTTLTLEATTNGTTFAPLPGGSWPINNLPVLGNMSAVDLGCELNVVGPVTPIAGFSWIAKTVPNTNVPADLDTDGDGIPNILETWTGTFVNANNTGTNPLVADSDGDGRSDSAEVTAGTDPNAPPVVPVAGLAGLCLLASAFGLGGAAIIRRKK